MADKPQIITVKSNLPDNRLALHEYDPAHPGGEIFVYGDEPMKVALTPAVELHLSRKELVRVGGKEDRDHEPAATADVPVAGDDDPEGTRQIDHVTEATDRPKKGVTK